MTVDAEARTDEQHRGGTWRGVVAAILGVLAVLGLTISTIEVWAHETVFDSDEVAAIVGNALAEPDVEAGLAAWTTDQVFTAVDVEGFLESTMTGPLGRFAPVLVNGARTGVERALTGLFSQPRTQELLTNLVRRAHGRAMDLLQGDGLRDGISVEDGTVTVNMLPLVGRGLEALQNQGLFDDLVVPELTAEGDPAEQIAALEEATGRDLPDGFGQLEVYNSERVAEAETSVAAAQQLAAVLKRTARLILLLSVVLTAATVSVARQRWLAAFGLGLGVLIAMTLVRTIVHRVLEGAPELATMPGGKAAIDSILTDATRGLLRLAAVVLLVAAAVTVVALWRRDWRRSDLILVGAVVLGLVILSVVGLSLLSLLLGLVVAVAAYFVASRWLFSPAELAS